jgi:Na+-exporting ATPase
MRTEIGAIAMALRGTDSKRRPVKRGPEGETKKRWYIQAWTLTTTDAIGRFLGTNVGTPLQRKLSKLALLLFAIAVIFAIVVAGSNNWRGDSEVIIYAVATGLAMIPACLVVVLTITMAVGTKQMVQRHVIVRKLDSLEALGAVTNICSDKTGTLTQGRMVAKRAWIPSVGTYSVGASNDPLNPREGDLSLVPEQPINLDEKSTGQPASPDDLLKDNDALKEYLDVAAMANLAHIHETANDGWQARGEPTDIAIQVFASRFNWGLDHWTKGDKPIWQQQAEYPFDSSVKKMSVIFSKRDEGSEKSREMIFTKGAVERVLEACTTIKWKADGSPVPLDDEIKDEILENMEALAKEGLRVLAMAGREHTAGSKEGGEPLPREEIEKDLSFYGLIGLYDPPRPETAGAISQCYKAGISVHMVTGDHPGTARAIAAQVGIIPANMDTIAKDVADAMVMTASEFDKLTEDEIDNLPTLPLVIARCAPNTKVRMIDALHRRGKYVAMTGDGVNDSPSLKRADVGIAMGQNGSDVAKDASELVLSDDNFASIINGIEEGRRIFDNIQKFVLHLLAENVALALTLLIGLAFKDDSNQSVFPIAPVEIIWIIMITSGLPDMGLGMEAAAPEVMDRPPQSVCVTIPYFINYFNRITETRNFHLGNHHRHLGLRSLDGRPLSLSIRPRHVPLGRWKPRHGLQHPIQRPNQAIHLRDSLPRSRHNIYVHDLVRPLPRLGDDEPPPQLLPNAARLKAALYPVDARYLAQQGPFLRYHDWIRSCFPDSLYPRYQPQRLQAYQYLLGMGYCLC